MKEKLAPIHFVQYQRIHLQEQIESYLADIFQLNLKLVDLQSLYGVQSSDAPLAEQIDHDNIHGWLEGHLVANEKRLSELIAEILTHNTLIELQTAYEEFGKKLGISIGETVSAENGQELYQLLQSILLDGMPCDKVNRLIDASEHHLVFSSAKDPHATYFENAGLPSELFHDLRKCFLTGLLDTLNLGKYTYSIENGAILHKVVL